MRSCHEPIYTSKKQPKLKDSKKSEIKSFLRTNKKYNFTSSKIARLFGVRRQQVAALKAWAVR